jgi:hypothetical protein
MRQGLVQRAAAAGAVELPQVVDGAAYRGLDAIQFSHPGIASVSASISTTSPFPICICTPLSGFSAGCFSCVSVAIGRLGFQSLTVLFGRLGFVLLREQQPTSTTVVFYCYGLGYIHLEKKKIQHVVYVYISFLQKSLGYIAHNFVSADLVVGSVVDLCDMCSICYHTLFAEISPFFVDYFYISSEEN